MQKITKTILIAMVICVGLAGVCPAGSDVMEQYRMRKGLKSIDKKRPTAMELLDKFTETADKTHTSFINQSRIHAHYDQKYSTQELAYLNGERDKYLIQEFRTDGKRIKCIIQKWGDFPGAFRPESEKDYFSCTYDGDKRYDHIRSHDSAGRVIIYDREPEESLISLGVQLAYTNQASQSFGYLTGDVERFDRILKEAGPGQMSAKKEELNGTVHYVIDAETNRGKYRIWLNPEKGYNFSKATVIREAGDFYMLGYEVPADTVRRAVIENTEFKKVDDLWVPVKAKANINDTLPNGGYKKSNCELELTTIAISPDHDALGSFSIDDIKEGARVHFKDGPPGKYIWRDGAVVDEDGNEIDLGKIGKETTNVGK